jgi:hypothetical protein
VNPIDLVLISVVFISLLISRVFGKFLTLQRVGSAAGIIVGIIVVLQFIPIDPTTRTVFSSIGLITILCLVVIFIIIPYFRSSNRLGLIRKLISQKLKWQFSNKPPVFDAEIVNRKQAYIRGTDSVSFRSRFRGNLTNGFLFYKIYAAVPPGMDTSGYLFRPETPNVDGSWRHVIYPHPDTADVWSDRVVGKLNRDAIPDG